jgi:hypothetical protein
MSAKVNLVATEFKSYLGVTYGFRLYDDYGQTYANNIDAAEWSVLDDMKLLQFALENTNENSDSIFDNVRDMGEGITINGNYYDHEEIQQYL